MPTFLGLEILTTTPDLSSTPILRALTTGETARLGQSADQYGIWPSRPRHGLRLVYNLQTTAAVNAFMTFLCNRRGGLCRFRIPSWVPELQLYDDHVSGATSLRIQSVAYSTTFGIGSDDVGRALFIYNAATDQLHYTEVTATSSPSYDQLTLATALPWAVGQSDAVVGFVYKVRLANDDVRFDFTAPDHAVCELQMIETLELPGATA